MQQIHALVLSSAPSGDVVSTADAKAHLRVDGSDDDTLIAALVSAAVLQAQGELRRALLTQTWLLKLDRFPGCGVIELPFGATAVTAVQYVDNAGATQTLAADQYVVDVASAPGRLCRADGATWPTTESRPHAVTVTMTCGFGNAAAVPEGIKQWIKLHVGALYRNREAFSLGVAVSELPNRFTDALLDPWRLTVV